MRMSEKGGEKRGLGAGGLGGWGAGGLGGWGSNFLRSSTRNLHLECESRGCGGVTGDVTMPIRPLRSTCPELPKTPVPDSLL